MHVELQVYRVPEQRVHGQPKRAEQAEEGVFGHDQPPLLPRYCLQHLVPIILSQNPEQLPLNGHAHNLLNLDDH